MSGLKQELGLAQGIGLLSTSLLGTGVFAVPALAALVAGNNSLWAWPILIILVFPIAIVFAILPTYPTLVAAVQMDDTGTTRIGKFVFNHPFFIPGTLGVALAVCFGFVLGSFML